MTDTHHKAPEDDSPALDGMLQQLAREENGTDREYVNRLLDAVQETDDEMHPTVVVIPMRYVAAVAAMFVVMGVAVWWALRAPERAIVTSEYVQVERAMQLEKRVKGDVLYEGDVIHGDSLSAFKLNDGTVVTIAAGTELTIDKPQEDERVNLNLHKGRCFLRVSTGKGRFVVNAGTPVEVLGTTFGVNRSTDKTAVAVYEGIVRVGGDTGVRLTRGLSAKVESGSRHPTDYNVPPNRELAWARPGITFTDKPLADVLQWIADNSSYRFNVRESHLREKPVSFSLGTAENLDHAVTSFLELHGLASHPGLTFTLQD